LDIIDKNKILKLV